MRDYLVTFWYMGDCRAGERVVAINEFAALALAMDNLNEKNWCDRSGFRIEIQLVA